MFERETLSCMSFGKEGPYHDSRKIFLVFEELQMRYLIGTELKLNCQTQLIDFMWKTSQMN